MQLSPRILIVTCLIFALSTYPVFAKSLYVNGSTGSDSTTYAQNDADHPWLTLGRACWGHTNRASYNSSEAAQAGDTVYIAAGTYSAAGQVARWEPAFEPINQGTSGNPITFEAVGTVTLTLSSGTGPVFGCGEGWDAGGRSYVTWDGFTSDENDHDVYAGEPFLAVAYGSDYVVFQNCIFYGKNLPEDERNHSAIRFEGATNCEVSNCYFSGFTGTGENHADLYFYNNDDILCEHNEHTAGNAAIWVKGPTNERIIFRYNLVHDTAGYAAVRFGPGSIDGRIYQNILYNVGVGLENEDHATESYGNYWVNNTVVTSSWMGMRLQGQVHPGYFYNNIIVDSGDAMGGGAVGSTSQESPTVNVFEHNLYYDYNYFWYDQGSPGNRTFTYWQETWERDTVSPAGQDADPVFVDQENHNYHLDTGSPALTMGVDVLDFDGDENTTEIIPAGAYVTGDETIGRESNGGTSATIIQGGMAQGGTLF